MKLKKFVKRVFIVTYLYYLFCNNHYYFDSFLYFLQEHNISKYKPILILFNIKTLLCQVNSSTQIHFIRFNVKHVSFKNIIQRHISNCNIQRENIPSNFARNTKKHQDCANCNRDHNLETDVLVRNFYFHAP